MKNDKTVVNPPRQLSRLSLLIGMWLLASTGILAAEVPPPDRFTFPASGVTFAADFPGARLDACEQSVDGEYHLQIRPETTPINDSAWYAFQIRSEQPQPVTVVITYQDGRHRYHPKTSRDGRDWTPLEPERYRVDREANRAVLQLDVRPQPLWVAGQELITEADFDIWSAQLAARSGAQCNELGTSVDGRPLWQLTLGAADASEYVLVIGRQHPPEVTGTMALMAFMETIAGDSQVARQFRRSWQIRAVPLMNPDGVQAGYWRSNRNRVDLNRDWSMFRQPETQAVRDEVQRLAAAGKSMRLLLDFHSTHRDVFYVQAEDHPTEPEGLQFTARWLDALQNRLPDYRVRSEPSNMRIATSMNWGYREFRIPAIIYEVGDNTDRQLIRTVAGAAAEEMMRLLTAANAPDLPEEEPSALPAAAATGR